jgi:hypothetical protein
MSLAGEDKPRKAAEVASCVATPARSQPELSERLIGDQVRQARRSAGLTQLEPQDRTLEAVALRAGAGRERPLVCSWPALSWALQLPQGADGWPDVVTAT